MKPNHPKPSDNWTCTTCGINKIFTRPEMKEHLETVHKLTNFKRSSKMVLHLDAATHHFGSFEIKVGGVDLSGNAQGAESYLIVSQRMMTEQERLDLWERLKAGYCPHCGCKETDKHCQCCNDE